MCFRDALHDDERTDGFIHSICDRQQAMIAKDHRAIVTKGLGDSAAPIQILDLHILIIEERVIFEENAGLLSDWLE